MNKQIACQNLLTRLKEKDIQANIDKDGPNVWVFHRHEVLVLCPVDDQHFKVVFGNKRYFWHLTIDQLFVQMEEEGVVL